MSERRGRQAAGRLLVIGLDGAPPEIVFDWDRAHLPHLARLMAEGRHGPLESTIPAITVPAWLSMVTGRDPGELGLYGFHNRSAYNYDRLTIADSTATTADTVWDLLSRAGRKVVVVGVPPSYPPKPVNGSLVSCFLTPDTSRPFTYPHTLSREIARVVGRYRPDVEDFRSDDRDRVLREIYEMTDARFRTFRHLLRTRDWDFAMMVEIGSDRIQHAFWRFHDPTHPGHVKGSPYAHVIQDYYRYLDREIGELVALVPDDTVILVVSDHGAKRLAGGICLNEWLVREGYLVLGRRPPRPLRLEDAEVDWARTRAWAAGGYYGRVFLNVRGREPMGLVDPADYARLREELAAKLSAIPDSAGRAIPTRTFRPGEIYRQCRAVPPDLLVYFGDLDWRAIGSVGHPTLHVPDNDTGPDGANHAQHGVFILKDPLGECGDARREPKLIDWADIILRHFNLSRPRARLDHPTP